MGNIVHGEKRKANTQRAIITKAMSFPLGYNIQYTRSPRLRHAQQFRSVYCIWLCAHIYIYIFILYEERIKKLCIYTCTAVRMMMAKLTDKHRTKPNRHSLYKYIVCIIFSIQKKNAVIAT